jgi:hypothetical protein
VIARELAHLVEGRCDLEVRGVSGDGH